jgi:hypothetical protein
MSPFPAETDLPPARPSQPRNGAAGEKPRSAPPPPTGPAQKKPPPIPSPPRQGSAPGEKPSADIEAEAAALFSDGAAEDGGAEPQTVDFNCPYCDTQLHLSATLAGKKTPCPNPECRRIIDVPKLEKTQRKDWRNVNIGGPALARRDDGPAPEGAWGSSKASVVSRDALLEAKAVKAKEYPRTLTQKVVVPTVVTLLVLTFGGVGLWLWGRAGQKLEAQSIKSALESAGSDQMPPVAQGALYAGAAEYYSRSGKEKSGVDARDHFGKALAALTGAPPGIERDLGLYALGAAWVDIGGSGDQLQKDLKVKWDEVHKSLRATLGAIGSSEARREAVRAVTRRLIAAGQADRVLPLTSQLYSASDADRAEAVAVVGMEFLVAGDKERAEKAAEQAISAYATKQPPALRASVVALAKALEKSPPKPGKGPDEEASAMIGQAEALARQGKWPEARDVAKSDKFGKSPQLRALVGVAAAAVDASSPDAAKDVDAAINFLHTAKVSGSGEWRWSAYRLCDLARRSGLASDRLSALADALTDPTFREHVRLEHLQVQLASEKQVVPENTADTVEPASVAGLLAVEAVARHNVRLDESKGKGVAELAEPRRGFAFLGVALGLQDRRR